MKDSLGNIFKLAWTTIKAVWDVVVSYFKTIWSNIANIFKVVKSVLSGDFKGAWDAIKTKTETLTAEAKEKAAEVFDKYMKVFAGADNTENITKDNIVAMQVSNSFKNVEDSSKFIKDYKILPIDDAEREKIEKFFQSEALKSKDPDGKVKCKVRVCFYVLYSLKIDE